MIFRRILVVITACALAWLLLPTGRDSHADTSAGMISLAEPLRAASDGALSAAQWLQRTLAFASPLLAICSSPPSTPMLADSISATACSIRCASPSECARRATSA